MIESGHSLPDLRDVEEYHDDRKIEKIYRRFRFLNNPVSFELKSDLVESRPSTLHQETGHFDPGSQR